MQHALWEAPMKRTIIGFAVLCLLGCTDVARDQPSTDDSLATVPVGPGTRPDALVPPDTPVSRPDTPADSLHRDTLQPPKRR